MEGWVHFCSQFEDTVHHPGDMSKGALEAAGPVCHWEEER